MLGLAGLRAAGVATLLRGFLHCRRMPSQKVWQASDGALAHGRAGAHVGIWGGACRSSSPTESRGWYLQTCQQLGLLGVEFIGRENLLIAKLSEPLDLAEYVGSLSALLNQLDRSAALCPACLHRHRC